MKLGVTTIYRYLARQVKLTVVNLWEYFFNLSYR